MTLSSKLPLIPASYFAIVLGLGGLGGGWRVAHRIWQMPAMIGEGTLLAAAIVWAMLLILFVAKWLFAREAALTEARHPIQCCFIGLAGAATMLIAGAVLPYSRMLALGLFIIGALYTIAFGVWRTGALWRGERDLAHNTGVLYLPLVAGSYVTAIVAGTLGYQDIGQMAFGAGFFAWLAIESVLLHRFYTAAPMPVPLRPTFGIMLAPPTVGSVAYLAVTTGIPDLIVHAMVGYGLLQALLMLRLLPWIAQQGFAVSYWAFSFGVTALGIAFLRLVERGDTGAIAAFAPYIFVAVNLVMLVLVLGTARLIITGRFLPTFAAPVTPPVP